MAVELNIAVDASSVEIPSLYSNRFQVVPLGEVVRISFAETVGTITAYRTAVTLTIENSKELAELITRLLSTAPTGVSTAP